MLAQGEKPSLSWITTDELEERIRAVAADAAATRLGGDTGQFSLAGAQAKIALYFDTKVERWGIPEGRTPTTHILKPATGAFDGQTENEHFCLRLASELGFSTAQSRVMMCGGMPVIVIARYDRIERGGVIRRVHQEDFCQAAAIRPQIKYQNQGGPSPKTISEILWSFSSSPVEDVWRFAESLIFHWLTAATDAHGKNYSMLIAPASRVRLAPLYDLASALPYPRQIPPRKAALAMKIGSHYRIQQIRRRDWEKLAREFRLPPPEILDRIANMAQRIPEAAMAVATDIGKEGLRHPVIRVIAEKLSSHAEERRRALTRSDG
jgi:serine/threonine-protein kinase HipA